MESDLSARSSLFWTLAVQRGLLTEEAARTLQEEASSADLRPGELVLRKALLDPVQVDIVETLLRPHDIVPGYELEDVLGHGGMGVVYRARQKNLNRTVALKTILINRMLDSKAAARFEQEAIAIGRLQHPHIVNAFDFGRHEGRLYLAMEFVRGKDLEHLIVHEEELDEALVLGLARQAVLGLAYAARTGVVHRDIKPANLMLDQSGDLGLGEIPTVKIADFGLAFLTDDSESRTRLTADNAAVGSPHYIAPEQLQQSHVDFRADIYALGQRCFMPWQGMRLSRGSRSCRSQQRRSPEFIRESVSFGTVFPQRQMS
ncbi:MAG: serine/threonine-protein kinase [Planctomycetales bacterium]